MKSDEIKSDEITYFYVLREIAKYESLEWLRKNAEKTYGLSYEEALEFAYENVRETAARAVKGKRSPRRGGDGRDD